MKLKWVKIGDSGSRYEAETPRYRFVMVAHPKSRPGLMVQHADAKNTDKPIDERECRSRWHAEKIAQRFEDKGMARRLR